MDETTTEAINLGDDFDDSLREWPRVLSEDVDNGENDEDPLGDSDCVASQAGTGGCDDTIKIFDWFDKIRSAWDEAGDTIQLKHNMCVRFSLVPALDSCDGCVNSFQSIAEGLAWDIPNGLVTLHLERKKAIVFRPGRAKEAASVDTALSWAKHHNTLAVAILARSERIEFAILEVTWMPGQSSRLHFLSTMFWRAMTEGARESHESR